MNSKFYYVAALGNIGIADNGRAITHIETRPDRLPAGAVERETPLLARAAAQLREYFDGRRKTFDLPLEPVGTPFQLAVWKSLLTIPYGETRSYKQVAAQIGKPGASRAVGLANNRNPISIVVPCHRVIGASGALVGYGGGLEMKRRLLHLEKTMSRAEDAQRP